MTVDILSAEIVDGIVTFEALDTSEENLMHLERVRDDCFERSLKFVFDTRDVKTFKYLTRWLHAQKRVKESNPHTYGDAIRTVVGIRTDISGRYLEWDD